MLLALSGREEIAAAQAVLQRRLGELLDKEEGPFRIGFQSGNTLAGSVLTSGEFWYHHQTINRAKTPRHWNAFGSAVSLSKGKSNSIVVEINIAFAGAPKRVAALFARESDSGEVVLLHRAKIGGGKRGVGKSTFLEWAKPNRVEVFDSLTSTAGDSAIRVAELGSINLVAELASFVALVAEFKAALELDFLDGLSSRELAKRAKANGRARPHRTTVVSSNFERSPDVVAYVKRRAMGHCELCGKPAPFRDTAGRPYLECHHIIWLARGGRDTIENAVALCPNCHRRMHSLRRSRDVSLLRAKASREKAASNEL